MAGHNHTDDSKTQISDSKRRFKHTGESKALMSLAGSGVNNHVFGKVATNAKCVYVYSLLERVLL